MILKRILQSKQKEVDAAKKRVSPTELIRKVDQVRVNQSQSDQSDSAGSQRFKRALTKSDSITLIAEVKKASPSKGIIRKDFDPAALGAAYADNGAAAISVLTDEPFFQGHIDHLKAVKDVVDIPVLRKEFIIDPYQVYETKMLGADALLLIVAALTDDMLKSLMMIATTLGLDTLVEVHTEEELKRALDHGAEIIGVNNRDLRTFHTSLDVSLKLADLMPAEVVKVSESGINRREDLVVLESRGFHAVLVGESIAREGDVGRKIKELLGDAPSYRRSQSV